MSRAGTGVSAGMSTTRLTALALNTFGRRMSMRRRELGYSQAELAHESGIGSAMVGAFERGDRRPSLAQAVLIARGLEVTVGYLLDEPADNADELADAVLDVLHGHGYARGARRTRSRVTGEVYAEVNAHTGEPDIDPEVDDVRLVPASAVGR